MEGRRNYCYTEAACLEAPYRGVGVKVKKEKVFVTQRCTEKAQRVTERITFV